jgi:hypothetical protein
VALHGHFLLHNFLGTFYALIADVHIVLAGDEDLDFIAAFATKGTMQN